MRMVVGLVSSGGVEKDVRESDDEGESDVEEDSDEIQGGDNKVTTTNTTATTQQKGGTKKAARSNSSSTNSPVRGAASHSSADGNGEVQITTRSGRKVKKVS